MILFKKVERPGIPGDKNSAKKDLPDYQVQVQQSGSPERIRQRDKHHFGRKRG